MAALPTETQGGLYDRPVLVIDPGMHTAPIWRADADAEGRRAVTGSVDKTVRVWSLADGTLMRTIRLPAGPGDVGKAYAVAISPDGATIAASGGTGGFADRQIYLFDRETGALVQRIAGLPSPVTQFVFSPDGQQLAAILARGGLRLYMCACGWAEIARDEQYGEHSYGAAFAPDGRLATTAYDGRVRLYTAALQGDVHPTREIAAPGGQRPCGIAFSPDGARLAVGYHDSTTVDVVDGRSLTPLLRPDLRGIAGGNLCQVAWSRDGWTLFAGGRYARDDTALVLAWSDASIGARRVLSAGQDTVMSLVPLPGRDLLVASQDPWLARLGQDGGARWVHNPPKADFRSQRSTLSVSANGTRIRFGFAYSGKEPAEFDLEARTLLLSPPEDGQTAAPRQTGLPIEGWVNKTNPTLAGRALALEPGEISRSLAMHPSANRFVLGTEWHLCAFDAKGTKLGQRPVPSIVWAVNITGDGRLVVAAYGDGTIRWHRLSDGAELLAFFPLPDRINWVAWTPEGFYAATPGARGVLRWHINRGCDAAADSVPIEDIQGFHRPAALPLVLQELDTARALGLADMAAQRRKVQLVTSSRLPPGAVLHLLSIGISAYNAETAAHLRLRYADRDAGALADKLTATQAGLYAQVRPQLLRDADAHRAGILRALAAMRANMALGAGRDLAVVHFSGHGALLDGMLYLLPHDIDARDAVGLRDRGLSEGQFRRELLALAGLGRVLVLLDACHAGATTLDGAALAMDATALRGLAAANVTVLTACSGSEVALEDERWQHGAFTRALLDAFAEADSDKDGLIGTNELGLHLPGRVRQLTAGRQNPGMEIRYDTTLFAAGV